MALAPAALVTATVAALVSPTVKPGFARESMTRIPKAKTATRTAEERRIITRLSVIYLEDRM
jgi:hypothetical protein